METLPAISPSYSTAKTAKPKIRRVSFGDGYSQRSSQGLNALDEQWSVTWENRPVADCNQIEAFLLARAGVEAFLWTAPRESAPKKWTCADWTRTPAAPNHDTIRATFVREYDL